MEQDHVRRDMLQGSRDESFNPYVTILSAYIAQLNSVSEADRSLPKWMTLNSAYAEIAEKDTGRACEDLLDELKRRHRLLATRASRNLVGHYVLTRNLKIFRSGDTLSNGLVGLGWRRT